MLDAGIEPGAPALQNPRPLHLEVPPQSHRNGSLAFLYSSDRLCTGLQPLKLRLPAPGMTKLKLRSSSPPAMKSLAWRQDMSPRPHSRPMSHHYFHKLLIAVGGGLGCVCVDRDAL